MAKRKKAAHTTKRRVTRRRVGAIDKKSMENILFAALGGVAVKVADGMIAKQSFSSNPDTDAKIKAAVPLIAGVAISLTMGKKDSKAMFFGVGMAAASVPNFASSMGLIAGFENMIAGTPRIAAPARRYLNGVSKSETMTAAMVG